MLRLQYIFSTSRIGRLSSQILCLERRLIRLVVRVYVRAMAFRRRQVTASRAGDVIIETDIVALLPAQCRVSLECMDLAGYPVNEPFTLTRVFAAETDRLAYDECVHNHPHNDKDNKSNTVDQDYQITIFAVLLRRVGVILDGEPKNCRALRKNENSGHSCALCRAFDLKKCSAES